MAKARILTIVMIACALTAIAAREGCAQTPATVGMSAEAQREAGRNDAEKAIKILDEARHDIRRHCALGAAHEVLIPAREVYKAKFVDISDMCLTFLNDSASEKQLLDFYKELATRFGGDISSVASLPGAIGTAAMAGQGSVAIGGGKSVKFQGSTAFDAGFTSAYQSGSALPDKLDQAQLKAATQACLENKMEIGTCYSVGYAQGSQSVHGR